MKSRVVLALACFLTFVSTRVTLADDPPKEVKTEGASAAQAEHRIILPKDFKWTDAPPSIPKGAKMAVIHGDPNAPGIFAMRIQLPAGFKVPPHWHPADENVTVISGELRMGLGEVWDESKGHKLGPGAVSIMPAGVRHFAWSKGETVIQVHAMGPWGITYVNPQDDPRNKK